MSVETDLRDSLAAASGVTSLVSTRIWGGKADPTVNTYPYIVYSMVGAERLHTIPGSGDPARYRMQIECCAETYASAKSVAAAVKAALQGNGYQQSEYDLYDDQTQVHSVLVDWSFIAD